MKSYSSPEGSLLSLAGVPLRLSLRLLYSGVVLAALLLTGSPAFSAAKPRLPAVPTGLTASVTSSSQVQLRWTDKASNEDGYYVEYIKSADLTYNGSWARLALAANSTSYLVGGLSAGTGYSFRVLAYNIAGGSASSIVTATTHAAAVQSCTYSISPTGASYASGGGSGSVSVSTTTGCSWTASSGASWITITSGASGTGSGTVGYSVAANTGTSSRSGTLTIAGKTFTVTQAAAVAACSYTISPTSASYASAGGSGSVSVSTTTGCSWTATSGATWISITSGASGTGNGTVGYSVAANTATSTRSGTLTIAGKTFTVTQAAAAASCSYTISPTSASYASGGGSGSVSVSTTTGCSWNASSGATWISITSGASGTGNGTVGYSVAANSTTSSRSGTLTIAGKTVTVSQAAAPCSYTISPTSASYASSGGSGSVSVSTTTGCSWTASSGATWISITSGASGTGNGTVGYSVGSNTSTSSRTGYMTIAGKSFAVSQAGAESTDTIAPVVTWDSPTSGSTISGTVTLAVTASDNVTVTKVEFFRGSSLVGMDTASPYTFTEDTTKLSDGTVTYSAKASDSAGNSSFDDSTVTVKNTATSVLDCVWSTQFGGVTYGSANPVSIVEDSTGAVVIAGSYQDSIDFGAGLTPSAGKDDVFILKLDASGRFLWCRTFGNASSDLILASALDSNNNIVVIGTFVGEVDFGGVTLSSQTSSVDVFVAKYAADGRLVWAKRFGGSATERGYGVDTDANGNIIVAGGYGYYGTAIDFGGGPLPLSGGDKSFQYDLFVAKLSPTGGHIWSRGYGGLGKEIGKALALDSYGDVLVAGDFEQSASLGGSLLTGAGNGDVFVAKYSGSDGRHLWSQSAGGAQSDAANGIAADSSGNVLITGSFKGSANFSGSSVSAINGGTAMFLAKYSRQGALTWTRGFSSYESWGAVTGRGLAVDSRDNAVVTGTVSGFGDFDGIVVGYGATDILLGRFSGSDGKALSVKSYGGNIEDFGLGVSVGAGDHALCTGFFNYSVDFGCGMLQSTGVMDGFASKIRL